MTQQLFQVVYRSMIERYRLNEGKTYCFVFLTNHRYYLYSIDQQMFFAGGSVGHVKNPPYNFSSIDIDGFISHLRRYYSEIYNDLNINTIYDSSNFPNLAS